MSINTDEQGNNVLDLGMRIRVEDTLGSEWVESVEVDAAERIEQVLKSSAVRNNNSIQKEGNSSEEFVFTHTNPINRNESMNQVKTRDLFKHTDKVQGIVSVVSGLDLHNDYANCIKHGVESISKLYNAGMKQKNSRKEVIKTSIINAGVRFSLFGATKMVPKVLGDKLPKQIDSTMIDGASTLLGDVVLGTITTIRSKNLEKKGFSKNNMMVQSVTGKKTKFTKLCTIGRYTAIASEQAYNFITSKPDTKVVKPVVKSVPETVKPIETVVKTPVSKKK